MCRWGEENVPVYWAKAREVLGPYVAVAMDAAAALALQVVAGFKLVVQYCTDKKPALEQWVSVSLTRCYRFYSRDLTYGNSNSWVQNVNKNIMLYVFI